MTTKFPNMSKSEILALARECSASLTTIGAAELERLAKAEGSSSTSESTLGKGSVPPEGSSPSASSASSGSEGSASAGGPPMDGAPPEGDGAMPPPGPDAASAAPAGPPPGMDPSAGAPPAGPEGAPAPGAEGAAPAGPSFEELVSLYAALPPPDLEAHAAAMQQAMSMKQGASAAPGGAPPPAGASPSPAGGPPPMGKGETVETADPNIGLKPGTGTPAHVETANPNIGPTKKNEADIADLKKTVEGIGQVLETILTAPTRKATTGITYIPMRKSEPAVGVPLKKSAGEMTRDEVHAALTRVCGTPKLTKAERAVVDEYYLNPGSVKLTDLEPIINKA